ncbi:MAG: CRTAC1 family protein [Myxococcales bacterium]|nr:CRTAC1 family protein [Myxococcales bacterium]
MHKTVYISVFLVVAPLAIHSESLFAQKFTLIPGVKVGVDVYYESNPPYGGGVAAEDFDGDGDIDLILSGGLFGKTIRYFRNIGPWTWVDATTQAGFGKDFGMEKGIAVADYDNDGDWDFYVAVWDQGIGVVPKWTTGVGVLYANDGSGHFVEVNSGIKPNLYSSTGAWGDYDKDGDLDLYVSNYFASPNNLFRNDNGLFVDVGVQAGVAALPGKGGQSFQATWIDLNFDGFLDLHVTNDRCYAGFSPNYFFSNQGNGTFVDEGEKTKIGTCMDAMGAAFGDYNRDGLFDLYVANTPKGHSFKVQTCDGFVESAKDTNCLSQGTTGWGILFEDFDYDGWEDIYVCHAGHGVNYYENKMFRNLGNGKFEDITAAAGVEGGLYNATGVARADLDGDGDLDIVIVNVNDGPVEFLRNDGPTGNYLRVKLVGTTSNRDGQGATVELLSANGRQRKGLLSSNEYLSTGQRQIFFGLGTAETVNTVVVRWPMGTVQTLHNVVANQVLTVVETATDEIVAGPTDELCGDGVDNNCDGQIDEGFGIGDDCVVGIGACMASGHVACSANGNTSFCKANEGLAGVELCGDLLDNDCDGEVDEGFVVSEPCVVGIGECENVGIWICSEDKSQTICSVGPFPAGTELCGDGVDNDCDGVVDNGFSGVGETCGNGGKLVCSTDKLTMECMGEIPPPDDDPDPPRPDPDPPQRDPENPVRTTPDSWTCGLTTNGKRTGDKCVVGIGACATIGEYVCTTASTQPMCVGVPNLPQQELCGDFVDNNCNGYVDEGFEVGQPCTTGLGVCVMSGVTVCTPDALGTTCDASPIPPTVEKCGDGVDNDCDGETDEGFLVGSPCIIGKAPCASEGILLCAPDGLTTTCVGDIPTCDDGQAETGTASPHSDPEPGKDGCVATSNNPPIFLLFLILLASSRRLLSRLSR